jgi:hypothetical protein
LTYLRRKWRRKQGDGSSEDDDELGALISVVISETKQKPLQSSAHIQHHATSQQYGSFKQGKQKVATFFAFFETM